MFASIVGLPLVFFNINYARKISILFENNKFLEIQNFTKNNNKIYDFNNYCNTYCFYFTKLFW